MKTDPRGAVGMHPVRIDAFCITCKESLKKKHGVNQADGKVMGWFLGNTGPRCIWCHKDAWMDKEFWTRTGHGENSASRWRLNQNHRHSW